MSDPGVGGGVPGWPMTAPSGRASEVGKAGVGGGNPLGLEGEEDSDVPAADAQDESAVVEDAVVALMGAAVALVHVDVVDAVESVGVAELCVDRLVLVLGELGAEREDLPAGGLALVEVEREQVL